MTRQNVGLAVGVLILVMLALSSGPDARAKARGWLNQADIVLVPSTSMPSSSTLSAGSAAKPYPQQPTSPAQRVAWISVDEAQRHVPFHIATPSFTPSGLRLSGAFSHDAEDASAIPWVMLGYRGIGADAGSLRIEEAQGQSQGGYTFPASEAKTVSVNGHAGTFVRGSWRDGGQWDRHVNIMTLSWDRDSLTYLLQTSGLKITQADLVRVAESLK